MSGTVKTLAPKSLASASSSANDEKEEEMFPSSVEEAGALLGMAITQLTMASSSSSSASSSLAPPAGMHSSFRVLRPVSNAQLLMRLYELRALLRSTQSEGPLVAAPSILAVLIKLIGVSTNLAPAYLTGSVNPAAAASSLGNASALNASTPNDAAAAAVPRPATPPMLSHAIRHVWVDCVTLCHVRGAGLTGSTRIHTSQFIRQMLSLASQNPRTARAAGGVRVAALNVVEALLLVDETKEHEQQEETPRRINKSHRSTSQPLVLQTAPWALDMLQVCLKALRSAGNGEATYRQSALKLAIAVAVASRRAQMIRLQQQQGESVLSLSDLLVLKGALEEKALVEAVKILKQATQDKLPEVRLGAAQFAAHLAPLLLPKETSSSSSLSLVEETLTLAWRNLDDESPQIGHFWSQTVARIVVTLLQYHSQQQQGARGGGGGASGATSPTNRGTINTQASSGSAATSSSSKGDESGSDVEITRSRPTTTSRVGSTSAATVGGGAGGGGRVTLLSQATSLKRILLYLVDQFVKVGGELVATRMGGSFSTGGRPVRVGIGLVVSQLLQLRAYMGEEAHSLTLVELIQVLLGMVGGPDMEKQLRPPEGSTTTLGVGFPSVGSRNWSKADAGVARAVTCRVLRDGISQVSSEPSQLALLQDLVSFLPTTTTTTPGGILLNAHQIQCVLVELSHLVVTLGEGITAKLPEIVAALKPCLEHVDSGVRHEAAVACHAVCVAHPHTGRDLVKTALIDVQMHHAKLMTMSSGSGDSADEDERQKSPKMRMFRRKTKETTHDSVDASPSQRAIHGLSIMVAMLVREMPNGSGGLPEEISQTVASVGEILIASQFNEILAKSNRMAVCACVRGGFTMIASLMATGPKVISKHVPRVFSAWQKACNSAKVGGKLLAPQHDLICIDAVLYSVVVFLKYCSELLLAIPEALTQITVLLEEILPVLMSDGRLGSLPLSSNISTWLESARASLLESFAWLPAGSYPMVADSVFAFASENIQAAVYSEISCSILQDILCPEDSLLDTCSLARVKRDGQSGMARDLDQTVLLLTAEFSHHEEREAVLHLQDRLPIEYLDGKGKRFRRSFILASKCNINKPFQPPTPLHEVGMWRRPVDPSSSAKIRLVDAAVQAFAATFGLKGGREQQAAMNMLEALVPQYFAQITRTLNSSLTEQSKSKDENTPVANITAVLLLCLQSLPLHESTNDVPIGLGPPWMNKAKDILLALLPSSSNSVRRAAAEGLALLATLGVTEDAHFLQSTVLHSLDEVRQGNKPDGKPRAIALEPVSAARAGSLLTLACIQRTEFNVTQRQLERARGRAELSKNRQVVETKDSQLPILQMMTRILPSIGNYGFTDFFEVRAFALQSFQVLLAYSCRLEKLNMDAVDRQLLRKAVEIIEENVCSAWIVASNDLDKGHESEKMGSECCFLAVVLRFMSFILPFLKLLKSEDNNVVCRFCVMARTIIERNGEHPAIAFEAMVFFEVMAREVHCLPSMSNHVVPAENPIYSMIPIVMEVLTPVRPKEHACTPVLFSYDVFRAAVFVLHAITNADISVTRVMNARFSGHLVAAFEFVAGCKCFMGTGLLRSMVVPRRVETSLTQSDESIGEVMKLVPRLILDEKPNPKSNYKFHLRSLLFAKALLSGVGSVEELEGETVFDKENVIRSALATSKSDAAAVYKIVGSPRWQSKTLGAQLASCCLREIISSEKESGVPKVESRHFNSSLASAWCEKQCQEAEALDGDIPDSLLAFHLQDLIASACMTSVASLDQSELFSVQESSLYFLSDIILSFCQIPDPEMPGSDVLHQYSQQIYSVVKHCLNSIDEIQTDGAFRVFLASCWTVSIVVKEKMTTEPSVLKRLMRPLIPPAEHLSFHSVTERRKEAVFEESGNYSNMIKKARVIFIGDLLYGQRAVDEQLFRGLSMELIKEPEAFAVESALVAFEGASLLHAWKLSLVGDDVPVVTTENDDETGLSVDEYHADLTSMRLVANSWPLCARASLSAFSSVVRNESIPQTKKDECFDWMKSLGALVLQGSSDSIEHISNHVTQPRGTFSVNSDIVAVECLHSLSLLLRASDILPPGSIDIIEFGNIAALLQKKLLQPLVTTKTSMIKNEDVVKQLCELILDLSTFLARFPHIDHLRELFSLVLCPLNILQKGQLTSERDPVIADIINASQSGTSRLVKGGCIPEGLVFSLIDFLSRQILHSKDDFAVRLHPSAKSLLLECMSHSAVSTTDKKHVMMLMAQASQWDVWGVIYRGNEDIDATESLITLKMLLVNARETSAHTSALMALGTVVKTASNIDVVGRIVAMIGVELLGLMHHYGTLASTRLAEPQTRHQCFADSLKVVLVIYQQLLKESFLAEFLSTIFETFIAVLRFNGLPNHPSPQEKGDGTMGRLVAQSVLHIARTSPETFKASMGSLNDQDRAILEFAVRGEMTGYATVHGQAPAKKKLNLKSFKK